MNGKQYTTYGQKKPTQRCKRSPNMESPNMGAWSGIIADPMSNTLNANRSNGFDLYSHEKITIRLKFDSCHVCVQSRD